MRTTPWWAWAGALIALGCGTEPGASDDGGADGTTDGGSGDGDLFSDGSPPGLCDGGQASCGGKCIDIKSDPKNCGGCGVACVGCQGCANGKCVCPAYQSLCGGKCIPTTTDPDNCGGCGVACGSNQVCSAGKCVALSAGCIPAPQGGNPGLVACNRRCVDPLNDSNNCGTCGTVCGAGKGCVDGQCVTSLTVGPSPAKCECSGPPITVGGKDCLGQVAQTTFRWALCSCDFVNLTSQLNTDSYDSTKGPYPPNPKEYNGGVGLNGAYTGPISNPVDVGGALWASGAGGMATRSPTDVWREAHVAGNLGSSVDPLRIHEDAYVGGNVTTSSSIAITKNLHVTANAVITGNVTRAATVTGPVTVPSPCDCGPKRLPIATWVAAAALANDNASINLSSAVLATPSNDPRIRLDLPCGIYYLTGINKPSSSVTINAKGRTALFIDGDVIGQVVSFVLEPNAEFDVFVKGTIKAGGELVVGSPNYPALSRTYVGSPSPLLLSGEAGRLGGNLYAAYAPVSVTSHMVLYGALYAGSFANQEAADIHYDSDVVNVGEYCPPPPTGCGDCHDCGNQACINGKCDACTNSSQCCPPLTCQNGKCTIVPN